MKALLGWMNDKMIDRYCHSGKAEQQLAVDTVGAHFSKILAPDSPKVSELIQ
jgi:hypothetical protein